ncbi:MAG: mechanosensitive ion channel [Hormoscilla sp. GM7CHS1pb]|nr:mechanosensitive ion channel [Hormoscilla sp. GM7CHS1pb]
MNVKKQLLSIITYHWFTEPMFNIGDKSLSLLDILIKIGWILLVIGLTRAFKTFLKRRLLVRLGIDEANREVISIIISYGLGSLIFLLVLQTIGFNLASLAVIAGGLGVGIGFGLQDVTKNFVSGMILLVEGKLKSGDYIEFDGSIGYIKEIYLRSTVIQTWDKFDLVVPNSKLVDNKVTNMSAERYHGPIKISVGVAYGSDTVLVTETLLDSAYREPAVLYNPRPRVILIGFGNSSLDFELWVYVKKIYGIVAIKSSLYFIIDYNFRQHNITIALPQRDLWLRNPEKLTERSHVYPQLESDVPNIDKLPQKQLPAQQTLSLSALLRGLSYFENFNDLYLRELIELGYRRRLQASEMLFREGDPGDAFYIVLSGSVEIFLENLNKHLATLSSGQFFGELSLMLGIPRTAYARALEDTILFALDHNGLEKILHEHPELSESIAQEIVKHQEELSQRRQQLLAMGLLSETELYNNPVDWVRSRLKEIFSL